MFAGAIESKRWSRDCKILLRYRAQLLILYFFSLLDRAHMSGIKIQVYVIREWRCVCKARLSVLYAYTLSWSAVNKNCETVYSVSLRALSLVRRYQAGFFISYGDDDYIGSNCQTVFFNSFRHSSQLRSSLPFDFYETSIYFAYSIL